MNHDIVSYNLTCMVPLSIEGPYVMGIRMVCTCGDAHEDLITLPSVTKVETAHEALKQVLVSLIEEL